MADARQFNIVNPEGHYLCPACCFPEYAAEPTYDVSGGLIGSTICACCVWEPGFDDNRTSTTMKYSNASSYCLPTLTGSHVQRETTIQ